LTSLVKAGAPPAEIFYRRLSSLKPLRPEDMAPLAGLGGEARSYPAGAELIPQGAAAQEHRMIAAGLLGEARVMSDGRRQIVALRVPGDVVTLHAPSPSHALTALTPVRTVDAEPLVRALAHPGQHPELRAAWDEAIRLEQAGLFDQIVRLGRLSAFERTAHLLLELHERLLRVDIATASGFHLPITQEVLADILGLSIVHVNRILQQLRRDGLLIYRSGQVAFPDRERLAALASYTLQFHLPRATVLNGVRRAPSRK
jgi:CRP-like cAMP-binding protein